VSRRNEMAVVARELYSGNAVITRPFGRQPVARTQIARLRAFSALPRATARDAPGHPKLARIRESRAGLPRP